MLVFGIEALATVVEIKVIVYENMDRENMDRYSSECNMENFVQNETPSWSSSMSSTVLIAIAFAFCILVILGIFVLHRRNVCCNGKKENKEQSRLSENDLVFNGFIKQYEKRVLAFLIEDEADRRSLDREKVLALRDEYGTELVRPAYDAQEQLGKCGINPVEVTRLQKAWIIRNGGNPNAHPTTREVERILIERNKEKAVATCNDISKGNA